MLIFTTTTNKSAQRGLMIALLLLLMLALGCADASDDVNDNRVAQQTTQAPPPTLGKQLPPRRQLTANTHAPNPLATQLFQIGAMDCAPSAHQLATLLAPADATSMIHVPQTDPNRSLLMATIVTPTRDSEDDSLTILSMAPNQASGCGASYQNVAYRELTCDQVHASYFPNMPLRPFGESAIRLGLVNQTTRFLLMPAGTQGCIIITQEIVK